MTRALSDCQQDNHRYGARRDRQIIETIIDRGPLDIFLLSAMFFPSLKMAQKRLQRLAETGKVKRTRETLGHPYTYYSGQRSAQLEHRLGVNYIRLWIEQRLKSWEQIEVWQYEINYGQLRPDALAAIRNNVTGKLRLMFLEYDRAYNKFDKVAKYERFYDTGGYCGQWWAEQAERFPPVLVVSEGTPTVKSKLEFSVLSFQKIVEEVRQCLTGNLSGLR